MSKLLAVLSLTIMMSCNSGETNIQDYNSAKEISLNDTFNLPLDTVAIIDLMNLKTEDSLPNLVSIEDLDTFYLNYVVYACDCQSWVVTEKYFTEKGNFNLDDFGYFIEPALPEIELDENFFAFNNCVRFIGKVHIDNEYPTESQIPQKKQILTYYSYKVLLPAKVYGPLYRIGEREIPTDSNEMIMRSVLTLTEK